MAKTRLRRVRPGQPITAELWNAMVDAIESIGTIEVTPPLEIVRLPGRTVLKLQYLTQIAKVELTATLTEGGNATAKVLWWDGSSWVDADTATITVYAETNMSGASGDICLVVWDRQSGRWIIFQKDC